MGVLVDKGTYGPCITIGGLLWSTGNSLRGKLLSLLVSAIAAWLCLSHTNLAAFCQSFVFISLVLFVYVYIELLKLLVYIAIISVTM